MRTLSVVVALTLLPVAVGAQEDVFSLAGLVVTVSPTPRSVESVATHVTVLDGEELRARGIVSVGEALRGVAGVDVVRNGSYGAVTSLFMRGGESDHTLVLVDGMQVNRAGGGFDFSALSTENVERIEIARGPSSALYGSDAMAGVIHVITRRGRGAPRVRATVEAASFSEPREQAVDGVRWSADVSGGSDRFGYSASLDRESTDGILAFNNQASRSTLNGRAAFVPDELTRLDLTVGLTSREFHRPTDGSGQVVDRNAFDFADESLASLRVSRDVSRRVELQALVGVTEGDSGTDDAPDDSASEDAFNSLDHFRRSSAEVRSIVRAGRALLTLGGEIEEERQRSFSEASSSFGTTYGRSENARLNRAGFVNASVERGAVAVSGGARLESNELFGTGLTWQAGLSAGVPGASGTRVRASAGTAIKEPTFFESFATGFVVGNPALDPERSLAWEVGLEHAVTERLTLQATYFDQRIEDLIQYTYAPPDPGDPNYHNVAGAVSRGVEVEAAARWTVAEAGATYTWLHTEVTDAGFDSGPDAELVEGERLLRRPTHAFALHGAGALGSRVRTHTSLTFVGGRADRSFDPVTFAATRVELPSYLLWTLGAAWDVPTGAAGRPDVSLSVRAENLLDASYQEAWGFEAPGRQLFLGVSVKVGGGS